MGNVKEKEEIMNAKTIKMKEFLEANKIECFDLQKLADEQQTAIFRSRMQIQGQTLPFAILIDISVYTLLQVQLAADLGKFPRCNRELPLEAASGVPGDVAGAQGG